MTFKFWARGGIKFDEKCAILQICKCNNYSEAHLLIAADGSVITELTEDYVARINSTVDNSTVKKEIPWRKKATTYYVENYNFLRKFVHLVKKLSNQSIFRQVNLAFYTRLSGFLCRNLTSTFLYTYK